MNPEQHTDITEVTLGRHTLRVPKGGLYDRYRMRTDLDEVAADPRVHGVDFFRGQPKVQVESAIGATLTPNFYYAMCRAQLAMLAPTSALRARLPHELDPLEVMPGYGLASLMLFRYDVADIDAYSEAAVGVAVRPPNHGRLGPVDLLSALGNNALDTYVLSLPVSTEIAQVRGHEGYGFPKWVTDIDVRIDDHTAYGRVSGNDGATDVEFCAPTPRQKSHRSGTAISNMNSYTQFDGGWHSTFSQTNMLASGRTFLPRGVKVTLGSGRLSDDLRSLRPVRRLSLEVTTSAQLALHMPRVLALG